MTVPIITHGSHSVLTFTSWALHGNARLLPQGGTLVSGHSSFLRSLKLLFSKCQDGQRWKGDLEKDYKVWACQPKRCLLRHIKSADTASIIHLCGLLQLRLPAWLIPNPEKRLKVLVKLCHPAPPPHATVGSQKLHLGV